MAVSDVLERWREAERETAKAVSAAERARDAARAAAIAAEEADRALIAARELLEVAERVLAQTEHAALAAHRSVEDHDAEVADDAAAQSRAEESASAARDAYHAREQQERES